MSAVEARGRRDARRGDDALLREIAGGDLAALGDLYDRYADDLWRTASRMLRSADDADDVVHAVFVQLPKMAAGYDGRASARGWLLGVTARFALRHRRSAARFLKMLTSFHEAQPPQPRSASPERQASDRQELRTVEAALGGLSPKKRAVFLLVDVEGLSADEVARSLRIPAATVRTRLHHARRELQGALLGERSRR